ncbi:MAG: hypothetical protein IJ679_11705, partial [Lachnospiraceae bacterium]|nr:hypothetical protein [Lachnospiraceae bacterium]
GEAMTDQLIYKRDELKSTINIATNSFGQNFNTTMVQLGSAFCSLINGGTLYQPHVVDRITDDAGNVIRKFGPVVVKKTVSPELSVEMRDYLYSVVSDGTADTADVNGYDIGGKTGTAQKLPRSAAKYLVSFIGYVPQENPEVMIYCIVDEPNVAAQDHSTYAQEIVHNILLQTLPYLGIEQVEPIEEDVIEEVPSPVPFDSTQETESIDADSAPAVETETYAPAEETTTQAPAVESTPTVESAPVVQETPVQEDTQQEVVYQETETEASSEPSQVVETEPETYEETEEMPATPPVQEE